ncbi:hypothetical protein P389DRAFT_203473 [Cystobasidium minutum MCA 4210]|uniref:uncharacterized protein n=1 Tax=Cystobasidium minutum MCA 4210 TaxID=1397322 RepID=UPI0034CE7916|eukprot:jgi/Rhomi1/203473/MIX4302_64_45
MGKGKAFAEQVRAMLRENVLGPLADIVHDNVTINGMSWQDNVSHEAQAHLCPPSATQPVNAGLLKSTIETQDAAFQLSSGNAVKRSTKSSQLAAQVDSRIGRVIKSGEEKTKLLSEQRIRRESSAVIQNIDSVSNKDVSADLQATEKALSVATSTIGTVREKAERAASIAADVSVMQAR